MQSRELTKLISEFRKLPSVGQKTATRYAYAILDKDVNAVEEFVSAIKTAKANVRFCKECGDYTTEEVCERCKTKDKSLICIVKSRSDITTIEKSGNFNGVFHVLGGTLDFQKGVGIGDIRIKELLDRLNGVKEVILAINRDVTGEMTSSYISQLLKPFGIKVTRPASGIPLGSELEYVDEITLSSAIKNREEI